MGKNHAEARDCALLDLLVDVLSLETAERGLEDGHQVRLHRGIEWGADGTNSTWCFKQKEYHVNIVVWEGGAFVPNELNRNRERLRHDLVIRVGRGREDGLDKGDKDGVKPVAIAGLGTEKRSEER